jgi:hypothetical protein|nr:DUF1653 domain-containing protein [uncultured Acetatifactor sp.]
MSFIPKSQEIYKHFKGNLYQVTAVAEHTETGEQLVIYQALYGDFKIYARPLSMFISRVDRTKYPDAEQEFRFELQGPEADRQWAETGPKEGQPEMTAGPGSREAAHGIGMAGAGAAVGDTGTTDGAGAEDGAGARTASDGELDPLVLEFLDADSYEERLNILAGLHHRITDEMITTMAIASDIEIDDGDIEERYESLRTCLLTLERYECNRLR